MEGTIHPSSVALEGEQCGNGLLGICMTAIVGGLGAALFWATSTLAASRSSRLIGPGAVTAWMMLVGLLITLPIAMLGHRPAPLTHASLAWLAVAGLGNVLGLILEYQGFRFGYVSIVATLASTEGAVAAVLATLGGEQMPSSVAAALALIVAGVVVVGAARSDGDPAPMAATLRGHRPERAVAYGIAAALAFGSSLYATGRVGVELPLAWAIIPARVVGLFVLVLPLAATARLRLTWAAVPLVVLSGLCEVLGFASFVYGARSAIAVSAVLASQFAAFSAVAAYVLFHERLGRLQLAGVTAIALGVAVLSGLHA